MNLCLHHSHCEEKLITHNSIHRSHSDGICSPRHIACTSPVSDRSNGGSGMERSRSCRDLRSNSTHLTRTIPSRSPCHTGGSTLLRRSSLIDSREDGSRSHQDLP